MEELESPKLIYQKIIDNLVENSESISSRLIIKESIFSRSKDSEKYNVFVQELTDEQRKLLSKMMNEERQSAIHDVLAELTWWIDCQDVTLNYKNQILPTALSDMGMHGDYIGRLTDWDWPE